VSSAPLPDQSDAIRDAKLDRLLDENARLAGSLSMSVERVAKTLHQLYGPSEIQAWGDQNFDHEPWYDDARLVLSPLLPRRNDAVHTWLKRMRDLCDREHPAWTAVDWLVGDYERRGGWAVERPGAFDQEAQR
jgi:hypothetical protein